MLKVMTPTDWADYLALSLEFYQSNATDHQIPEKNFRLTFDETVNGSPLARGWMITEEPGGPSVGYLLASLSWSNEFGGRVGWLEELYLKASTRGRGLGKKVLDQVVAELKERDGVVGLRLEVTPANKDVAILYEKLGFTPIPYLGWWQAL